MAVLGTASLFWQKGKCILLFWAKGFMGNNGVSVGKGDRNLWKNGHHRASGLARRHWSWKVARKPPHTVIFYVLCGLWGPWHGGLAQLPWWPNFPSPSPLLTSLWPHRPPCCCSLRLKHTVGSTLLHSQVPPPSTWIVRLLNIHMAPPSLHLGFRHLLKEAFFDI